MQKQIPCSLNHDENGNLIITTIIRGNEERMSFVQKDECISWLNGQINTLENNNSSPLGHEMTKEEMLDVSNCYKNIIQELKNNLSG